MKLFVKEKIVEDENPVGVYLVACEKGVYIKVEVDSAHWYVALLSNDGSLKLCDGFTPEGFLHKDGFIEVTSTVCTYQ